MGTAIKTEGLSQLDILIPRILDHTALASNLGSIMHLDYEIRLDPVLIL